MKEKALQIIVAAGIVAIFDAIFKIFAIKRLPEEGVRFHSPIGFALHKNPGIAFDIPIPLWIVAIVTIAITGYLFYLAHKKWPKQPLTSAFAAIVIFGALGNLLDRIINGFTTDYIILFNRSAINLSDILIILGIALLLGYPESKEAR